MKNLSKIINKLPHKIGVYTFRDESLEPLYVGKALDIKSRVVTYFKKNFLGPKTKKMVSKIQKIEHIITESEIEALLLEAALIKKLRPQYNVRLKDDKSYQYIKITIQDDFPKVITVRNRKKDGAKYFGPFPQGYTVKQVLRTIRKIFPYCNKKAKYKRACFYYHLNLCPGPCANTISKTAYRKIIHQLIMFLSGKKNRVVKSITKEMRNATQKQNFEKAALLRDQIQMIKYVTQTFRCSRDYILNPNLLVDQKREELESLINVLKTRRILSHNYQLKDNFRIESYDISNIKGKYATGAMVVFVDGLKEISHYRRFRIKLKDSQDDIAMMKEVLNRRFKKIASSSYDVSFQNTPDLVLVDGGKGQLGGALEILKENNIKIPCIALAKRLEEIIIFDTTQKMYKSITLKKYSPALKILQRTRDEAHRFSVSYHRTLRRRAAIAQIKPL